MLKKIHSILAVVLSVVLVFSLAGCGKESGGNDTDEDHKEEEAKVIDLDGREVTFVTWGATLNIVEDSEDELMQNYYARMKEMEKKYNCTFVFKKVAAGEILSTFRAAEMGGSAFGDVVLMRQAWAKSAYTEGILLDLSQVFDGSKEQFYQPAVDFLKEDDGKFYSIAFYQENPVENVYYFNQDHFKNQGIDVDALYQEVLDGNWTFERMFEIAKKATVVKNGVTEVYGAEACTAGDSLSHFLTPFGAQIMEKNTDGTYSSGLKSDSMQKALENVKSMWDSGYFWKMGGNDNWETASKMFGAGTLSMYLSSLAQLANIKANASFDIGVLPMPKRSAEDNYTYSSMTTNIAVMPASLGNDMETAQAIADMVTYIYSPIDDDVTATLRRKYSMYCSDEQSVQILLDAALADNFVNYNYIATGMTSTYNDICKSKLTDALSGKLSITAAIDSVNDAWQASIEEYNRSLK